jgi:hypothetical protein
MKVLYFIFTSLLLISNLYSQDHNETTNNSEHELKHSIGIMANHTTLGMGIKNSKKKTITVPSWAINYNYRLSEKWFIGLHTDIIFEEFIVETHEDEEIEREVPIANIIVGTYKITKGLGLVVGGGIEWEKNRNFGLARIGLDYGFHIPGMNLESQIGLNYDILFNGYNALNLGIGIAKLF